MMLNLKNIITEFKLFEKIDYQGMYWQIRTDEPYLSKSLEYLNNIYPIPEGRFDFMKMPSFINHLKKRSDFSDYVIVILDIDNYWEWDEIENEIQLKGYEYMGCLEKLEPEDLDSIDLRMKLKKYNI